MSFRKLQRILLFIAALSTLLASQPLPVRAEEGELPERSWRDYLRRGRRRSAPEEKQSRIDSSEQTNPEGMVDIIDTPTPNVVDYGGYRLNFRFYKDGGLLSHISFGVFRRLNIGASWDNEKVIGTEDPRTNKPALNAKFRIYDGGSVLPAVALGYDGQGRFFDKAKDEYSERDRGLYLSMGRELFFPRFEVTGGVNISKFKEGEVYGSLGLSYTIEEKFVLMTEYDNIRNGVDNRWNAGIRVFPIPAMHIDFAFRQIASNKDKDRLLRINFVGSF